jgi:glutaredoxin
MNTYVRRIAPLVLLVAAGWLGVQLIERNGSERIGRELAAQAKPGDIVMLSSDTCEYCKQARAWFKQHHVAYAECSIERDPACRAVYDRLQSPGTPMLLVRGQRQVGFSAERVALAVRQG